MTAFDSQAERRAFVWLCVATFLLFTTGSTLAVLAVVLRTSGHDSRSIGIVLSSPVVPVVFAILVAGKLLRRFNPMAIAWVGLILMLFSFAGFEWTVHSTAGSALCRALFGLGFGVFFASSTFIARDMLKGPQTVYLFGIFGGMITLPNVIGPGLAEAYLHHFGVPGYFLTLSVPAACAAVVMTALLTLKRRARPADALTRPNSYAQIYRNPLFRVASFTNFAVGIGWGMAFGYCAVHLTTHAIPIAAFFSAMTIAFFSTRFILMRLLQQRSRFEIVGGALMSMALSFVLVGAIPSFAVAVVAGCLYGVGYSAILPIVSVWASDLTPPIDRPMAMALYNVHFHVGFFSFPLLMASFNSLEHLAAISITVGVLNAAIAMIYVFVALRQSRPSALRGAGESGRNP